MHEVSISQLAMKKWRTILAPYQQANDLKAWIQVADSLLPLVAVWALMAWSAASGRYWLTLLLTPIAGGLITRIFIIQHDCGHGSFFSKRKLNDKLGAAFGLITLFPYGYWRKTHAIHHATHGNLERRSYGDITTLTVREYLESSWSSRFGYRLYRNPVTLFLIGPAYQFFIKHRLPFDIPLSWKREWASVLRNNLMIACVLLATWKLGWLGLVLKVHLPIVLFGGAFGIWLFYVQHQFEDAYWAHQDEWSYEDAALKGSTFYDLPAVLRWFSGNIGFHHIHHLSAKIPNYRLRECMENVPELQKVTRLKLISSLKCLQYRLWDEDSGRMISFGDLRRQMA